MLRDTPMDRATGYSGLIITLFEGSYSSVEVGTLPSVRIYDILALLTLHCHEKEGQPVYIGEGGVLVQGICELLPVGVPFTVLPVEAG